MTGKWSFTSKTEKTFWGINEEKMTGKWSFAPKTEDDHFHTRLKMLCGRGNHNCECQSMIEMTERWSISKLIQEKSTPMTGEWSFSNKTENIVGEKHNHEWPSTIEMAGKWSFSQPIQKKKNINNWKMTMSGKWSFPWPEVKKPMYVKAVPQRGGKWSFTRRPIH